MSGEPPDFCVKSPQVPYIKQAMSTYSSHLGDQLIVGALGLAGETGEVVDIIKKARIENREIDRNHLIEELGDVMWYLAVLCDELGVTFEKVQDKNIEKLRLRYSLGG